MRIGFRPNVSLDAAKLKAFLAGFFMITR